MRWWCEVEELKVERGEREQRGVEGRKAIER